MNDSASIERQEMLDLLVGRLRSVIIGTERLYVVESTWKGEKEEYYFSIRDLSDMVDDIIGEHPRVSVYRIAQYLLLREEVILFAGWDERYNHIDKDEWLKLRDSIVDPAKDRKGVFHKLTSMKINPTSNLYDDENMPYSIRNNISNFRSSLLVNNLWRSPKDFKCNETPEAIKARMIDEIKRDPSKSLISNQYLYGALTEHATLFVKTKC